LRARRFKITTTAIQRLVVIANLMPQRGDRIDCAPIKPGRVVAEVERAAQTLDSQQLRQAYGERLAVIDVEAQHDKRRARCNLQIVRDRHDAQMGGALAEVGEGGEGEIRRHGR